MKTSAIPAHLAALFLAVVVNSAIAATEPPLPASLVPYFTPNRTHVEALTAGRYPSPLKFAAGRDVTTPAEWLVRRRELLALWHGAMGAWPALLDRPQLSVLRSEKREDFIQHRVNVPLAQGMAVEGWLLVPPGEGPFPAVLVPFYEPETSIGLKGTRRDFALQLVRRGFVALAIGSPGGDARLPDLAGATCQPLSFLAYIAANCERALAQRRDVDPARIGVVGHSYGGKWALFASALHEPFAAAAWSDPELSGTRRVPT